MFFWQILYILHFENNNMMLHFFAYHDSAYCSWKDLFALDAYSAYLQYMAERGTVENAPRILEF
jgi:Ran GTPase-activating protein (RanGAP) involved in mRNA processing and transport